MPRVCSGGLHMYECVWVCRWVDLEENIYTMGKVQYCRRRIKLAESRKWMKDALLLQKVFGWHKLSIKLSDEINVKVSNWIREVKVPSSGDDNE